MARRERHNSQAADEGFVLPFVLVVIFVLALTSAIAVRSINASSQIIIALNDDVQAQQRLNSAEADTLFVYLTSAPVKGGIDTSYTVWTGEDVLDGFDVSRLAESAIWSATGGIRSSHYPSGEVRVTYRDVAGFIPMNRDTPDLLLPLLSGVGLKKEDAQSAASKLGDYTDSNHQRRFRGGERADYRLKRLPPPSDAPLRTYEEVYHILEWDKYITPEIYNRLREYSTLTTATTYYRTKFLSSRVKEIMGLDATRSNVRRLAQNNVDLVDTASTAIETPTKQGRFYFSTPMATGRTAIRVIELERSPLAPDQPFRRHVVFEETRDAGDTDNTEDALGKVSKPVFSTADHAEK